MFERLTKDPPPRRRSSRCPAGSTAGARICRRREDVLAPACRQGAGRGGARVIRIHQVLATLGYGDAIGHEVLGIQRVLRAAGYESEIFVETADHRLEPLTRDYRELVDASHPDNLLLHHFSLGSQGVADGVRAARSDGAHLPQHHAAGVLRRRAPHARAAVLSRTARAAGLRRPLRPGAGRLGVQPPGSRGARLPADRRCCRSCPTSRTSTATPNWLVADEFDDDWTNILFVGRVIAEQEDRGSDPLLPRVPHDASTRDRGCCIVGAHSGFERYLASLHQLVADARTPARALRRPRLRRGAGRLLRDRRSVPLRQRARGLLRAARRGVLQAGAGARLRRDRGAGRRWTAPACCTTTRIRCTSRR